MQSYFYKLSRLQSLGSDIQERNKEEFVTIKEGATTRRVFSVLEQFSLIFKRLH